MIETESVMTVFAGTNGAGKSTISFQMKDYVGTIIDPDQIAKRINPEDPRSAEHIDRVASRVEQGGHWIAEEDIRYRYGQSLSNLKPALEISDEVTIIDNTGEPEVVAEIKRSQISFCRDEIPVWAKGALESYTH
ncbi:hypothetical protein [Paenibacillus sp. FSL H3-0333]|uniref:hypothetical protein n=1 Tax=Paenibacillus sp. FSL H3-0333 TaxID=2921373 RepID=UPI0030F885BB